MIIGSAAAAFGVVAIFYIVVVVLTLVAWAQILRKAGYSPWWTLVAIIPLVNLIMFFVFAFSDWPVSRGGRGLPSPPYGAVPPPSQYGNPPPPGSWQG